ncbi:IQ motif containing with AAA domain 1 [Sesbania bispinosa]|nr:IQ motif containing with AAA domain 1 [Sesbania bispinosa]
MVAEPQRHARRRRSLVGAGRLESSTMQGCARRRRRLAEHRMSSPPCKTQNVIVVTMPPCSDDEYHVGGFTDSLPLARRVSAAVEVDSG